ncbi:JAB domain-containing protein [Polyangium aurulentum]|uniref:JAB domain-containing protein n=1 Tax=Polyangium aurulentum TaxID=2567896 RepID=UPI0010AEC8D3|nr:JAB domain-containing protein [Polyangium aurulentum]UQA57111.1 JAB domain-containing protein [Polyangium aurulentum]
MAGSPDDAPTAPTIDLQQSTTENLIDLVLGRPGVATNLLGSLGGLPTLARFTPIALTERFGLTLEEATRLLAALELGRRGLHREMTTVSCSDDVAAWARPRIGHLTHEEMWLIALDGQSGVRGARMISRGGLHSLALRTSDVLRAGLEMAASGFVMVHNHPSGNPTPTKEDIVFTQQVLQAGDLVGMPLLDHVVVTSSGQYSNIVVRPE